MPTEEVMKRDIEKILTNGFEYNRITKEKSGKLLPKQIAKLKEYKEYYESKPSSKGGRIKLSSVWNALNALRYMGLFINKPYEDAKKEDMIAWAKSLKDKGHSTASSWKVLVRGFYKWLYDITDKHKFPEVVDDPILQPEKVRTTRTPDMLPSKDEVKAMVNAAGTNRDKSKVMLTYGEGGLRGGEIVGANVTDLDFDERGAKLWIRQSKTEKRYIRLIDSEPYLREYINKEHEFKDNPNSPLFYSHQKGPNYGKRLSVNGINECLQILGRKAGIKKRLFTHLGRHNAITELKKLGLDSSLLAKRAGINLDTLERVYLHSTDKDVDDGYMQVKGEKDTEELIKIKEEKKKLEPRICPRCQERNPATALYCNCGMMLDKKEAISYERMMETLINVFRQAGEKDPEIIERVAKALEK